MGHSNFGFFLRKIESFYSSLSHNSSVGVGGGLFSCGGEEGLWVMYVCCAYELWMCVYECVYMLCWKRSVGSHLSGPLRTHLLNFISWISCLQRVRIYLLHLSLSLYKILVKPFLTFTFKIQIKNKKNNYIN